MKILIDARSLGSKPSGIGIYIYNFAKELVQYPDVQMFLVTDVVVSQEIKNLAQTRGVTMCVYGKEVDKSFGLFAYYKFVQKTIHTIKPDIFWEGNNLVPITIRNPYGKFVTTVHDMFPIYMKNCYGKIYPYYFKYGIYKTMKQVDAIIYNSEETRKETEMYFPEARNVQSFISYIVVDCKKQTNLTDDNYFLYIGNLERRKGTDILLRAYDEYRRRGGTKKLVFAGKFRENAIEQLYQEIISEIDGLEYVGYADEDTKDKLLAGCSSFLFPSRAEGFGIPVVEALSYGKPVLTSKLPIFDEIVGDVAEYVDCEENNAVSKWAERMLEFDVNPQSVVYDNPYTAEILGKNIYKFFVESVK